MILIVDDRQENLFSLQKLLELNQFKVDTAASGEDALKKILKNTYFLIILDVQMPGMDGFEVAEAIAGYSKSKDIPIIFLSAINTEKRFITKGYSSGAIDYVTKPFDPDILLLKVKTFYRLHEQTQTLNDIQKVLRDEIEFRKRAEQELHLANQLLEKRVLERTSELQEANRELEASNHELQQFAYVASHDLKEPLRKIQVFSHMIKERYLQNNPEAIGHVDRIIRAADRMNNLITDVLGYSELSISNEFKPTNINQLIDDILLDTELLIQEKKAIVRVDAIPPLDVVPGQMRQVFQNIISNALKFSKNTVTPIIHIHAEQVAGKSFTSTPAVAGKYCRIQIRDNGIGFNEIYLDRIFSIFQRLHSKGEYEGTGIGLAIVKKIIDKHNGLVTATSKEGEGSTFTIVLPVTQNGNPLP
jgi:signal transduction histidine kinase